MLECRQCVAACQPGATLRQVHQLSVRLLCDGLAQLRIFPGLSLDTLAGGAYQTVYPHSVGARLFQRCALACAVGSSLCCALAMRRLAGFLRFPSRKVMLGWLMRLKAGHTAATRSASGLFRTFCAS